MWCIAGGRAVVQGILAEALQPLTQAAEQAASSFMPEDNPASSSLLASLSVPCAKLQSVLTGLAATQAQALVHRAPGVGAFASQLKVCFGGILGACQLAFLLSLVKLLYWQIKLHCHITTAIGLYLGDQNRTETVNASLTSVHSIGRLAFLGHQDWEWSLALACTWVGAGRQCWKREQKEARYSGRHTCHFRVPINVPISPAKILSLVDTESLHVRTTQMLYSVSLSWLTW